MTTAPRERTPGATIAVVSLGVLMSSLDLFVVNLAFPSITKAFHGTTLSDLSWVLNAYTIVFAAVLVPAGRWADRIGRRRVFSAGLIAFTIGSALCGLAPDVGLLVSARVIQALGAGMLLPSSLSLLLAVTPPEGRAKAIGLWSAVGALGAGLGPVVGGLLVQVDWRLVFWINIPIGVAAVLLTRSRVEESREPKRTARPDLLAAVLIAAVVGAVAWALVESPGWGWASGRVLGLYAAAVAGLVLVALRSGSHPSPVIAPAMLRDRGFAGATIASSLYYAGFGAFVLLSVEFLTGAWHYSAVRAGLAIAPGPLTVLPFARVVAPRLAAKFGGPGRVAVLGGLVNAAAQTFWLVRLTSTPGYAGHLLPAQLIGGAGVGLTIPSLLGAGTAGLAPAMFGAGSGVLNMARQLGTVLGVAALVGLLEIAHPSTPLAPFRHGLILNICLFSATAVVALIALAPAARRTTGSGPVVVADLAVPVDAETELLVVAEESVGVLGQT